MRWKWKNSWNPNILFSVLVSIGIFAFGIEGYKEIKRQFLAHPELACTVSDALPGTLTVPIDAQHKHEIVWRATAPDGFSAVLPLMQVVSVAPCAWQSDQKAELVLRAIRLIEHNPKTGEERVVTEVSDFSSYEKPFFVGRLFERFPSWYASLAQVMDPVLEAVTIHRDKFLVIDVARVPQQIYHGWIEPQVEAKPGMNYFVEVEVKITGLARLQIGIDYWRSIGAADIGWKEDCNETNHCEGYLSDWFGPSLDEDWQTLRAPHSF